MSIGFWQIAVVVILVVLLFGRGKISSLMGDVAKGIKSFKKGMSDNPDQTGPTSSPPEEKQDENEGKKEHEEEETENLFKGLIPEFALVVPTRIN